MEKIELPVSLVNDVLLYLSKKPYEEVYLLISAIHEQAKKNDNNTLS